MEIFFPPCNWIGRLDIKMSVLPKLIYRFSVFQVTIPENYFYVL